MTDLEIFLLICVGMLLVVNYLMWFRCRVLLWGIKALMTDIADNGTTLRRDANGNFKFVRKEPKP